MIAREDIISEARTWIGTPWRHQGRLKGIACDCAGLIIGVMDAIGVPYQDIEAYDRHPDGRMLQATCDAQMTRAPLDKINIGDVVLMAWSKNIPQHLGIIGTHESGLSIIHAYAPSRKVVETIFDQSLRARVVAAYSLAGL